jgi:hypothetical protein
MSSLDVAMTDDMHRSTRSESVESVGSSDVPKVICIGGLHA